MKISAEAMSTFQGLRAIVAALRAPDGCPWDRIQTHQSLMPYLLEEANEALEALEEGNPQRLLIPLSESTCPNGLLSSRMTLLCPTYRRDPEVQIVV